jgi:hypothetical protein
MAQQTQVSTAELVYQRLDELTDGIEAFLEAWRDEVWTGAPYMDFHITTLPPNDHARRLMFGFRTEINGDQCPDPVFGVTLLTGEPRASFDDLIVDTLLGYFRGLEGYAEGNDRYCAEFLDEMVQRKRQGIFTHVKGMSYYPEAEYDVPFSRRPRA